MDPRTCNTDIGAGCISQGSAASLPGFYGTPNYAYILWTRVKGWDVVDLADAR